MPSTTLDLVDLERSIDTRWFIVNPDVEESFYHTMTAMYEIIDKKLYKSQASNLQQYLLQRWRISLQQGRNFGQAGQVIQDLCANGIEQQSLPTNVTLLLSIKKMAEKKGLSCGDVWRKAMTFFGGRRHVVACQLNLAFEEPVPTPLVTQLEKTASTRTESHLPSPESEPEASRTLRKRARVEYQETEDLSTDEEDCRSNTPINVPPSKNVQAQLRILDTPDWLDTKIKSFAYPRSMNPFNTQHWEKSDIAYVAISHGYMETWQRIYQEMRNGNIKAVIAFSPLEPTEDWCKLLFSTGMIGILHRPINKRQGYFICYLDSDETYPLAPKFCENFSDISFIPNATARIYKVPHSAPTIRYLSLFSGIGTGEYAIHKVFPDAICVGFSEIDPSAIKVYQTHFPTHVNLGDISKIDVSTIPPYDLLIGGSCCQSFSAMRLNKKHLNKDFYDERGQLFFEFIRILKGTKPKHVLFENVRMNRESQETISSALKMNPILLNAKDFSPQKRPRLYWCNWFVPKPSPKPTPRIEDIMEKNEKTPIAQWSYMSAAVAPRGVYCSLSRNFSTRKITLLKDGKCKALLCSDSYEQMVCCDGVYRFLTRIEKCRLQGLPDDWMDVKLTKTDVARLLGNSFQGDVISYLLSHLK